MNSDPMVQADPPRPSRTRFWIGVVMVFLVQLALIFWLERSRVPKLEPPHTPVVRLVNESVLKLLAIEDPTLFALPHPEGFSGEAWMRVERRKFAASSWSDTEPPLLLRPTDQQFGHGLKNFVGSNALPTFETIVIPSPAPASPPVTPPSPLVKASRLRITGDLARRDLLSAPSLPSWTHSDLLTNTVVQVLVDGTGETTSAVRLPPGSGLDQADQFALKIARAARFAPVIQTGPGRVDDPSLGLTIGTIIFEWQTRPTTNGMAP